MFDGTTDVFEMLKRPDTITVICIKNDKIVILDEEQPGHLFYGLPGGRHDVEGETELDAAKREVREETGLIFKNWKLVDVKQRESKIDWFMYTFVAWDIQEELEPEVHPGEKIIVQELNIQEAIRLADHPKTRHIPKDILQLAGSVEGLINWPEFKN